MMGGEEGGAPARPRGAGIWTVRLRASFGTSRAQRAIVMSEPLASAFEELMGREVVVDVRSTYVILGTLCSADARYLVLEEADVHDLRDTQTNRELYVLESRRHGIHANRRRVLVSREEVVCVSLLADVVEG